MGCWVCHFYIVLHSFPWVIDFRPEVPASIHSAMLQLVCKYHAMFSFNGMDIEVKRVQALALIRTIRASQQQQQDNGDRQQLVAEAERLLCEARSMIHYEKILALKVQLTWTELRLLQGEKQAAVQELRAALAELPEAKATVTFHVRRAMEWLEELEADGAI